MEIRTSSEILNLCAEGVRKRLPKIKQSEIEKKKWIAVDDVIDYINNKSFGYKDLGCNAIDGDELEKELNKRRSIKEQ